MGVLYSNMEDIIYCYNEEVAEQLFKFLISKGYPVGLSSSTITTGTHGLQSVKKLDVFKKKNVEDVTNEELTKEELTFKFINGEIHAEDLIDEIVKVRTELSELRK